LDHERAIWSEGRIHMLFLQHRDRNSEIILNNSRKIKFKMKIEDEEVIVASSKDEIYQQHDSNRQIDLYGSG
jgi:hypothetical protein